MRITHNKINCRICMNYSNCKEIENKFADELIENGGNWRAIFSDGKRVGTPVRRCSHAIVKAHSKKFKNKKILEIGCGPLSEIDYNFCKKNNINYLGIDPTRLPNLDVYPKIKLMNQFINKMFKYYMNHKIYYKKNNYQSYIKDSFPSVRLKDKSFDLIYANSSIEHWNEKIEDYKRSLELYKMDISYCYKLLKPGGHLLINCPMNLHGNKIFKLGKLKMIECFFDNDNWQSVIYEHWREQFDDLMPYAPEHRKKYWKDEYKIKLINIWLGNIVAMK